MISLQNCGISYQTIKSFNQLLSKKDYDSLLHEMTFILDKSIMAHLISIRDNLYNNHLLNDEMIKKLAMHYRDIVVVLNEVFNIESLVKQKGYQLMDSSFINVKSKIEIDSILDRKQDSYVITFDIGPLECFALYFINTDIQPLSIEVEFFINGFLFKFSYKNDEVILEEDAYSFMLQLMGINNITDKELPMLNTDLNMYDLCCICMKALSYYLQGNSNLVDFIKMKKENEIKSQETENKESCFIEEKINVIKEETPCEIEDIEGAVISEYELEKLKI